ncbi:MAG: sulfatase [Solibacterales bacterium]|nr:sulfatase [Bryobacterales bacterium]|tara:strand:+ start:843 stop:2294 length:1452 start_codon:yes stop_codon:yes gene_type:complete
MHPSNIIDRLAITRRHFFKRTGVSVGTMGLASLLASDSLSSLQKRDPLAPRHPHFEPKAKRIIFLLMAGAPSQLDLFDYKPELEKHHGKPVPESLIEGQRFAFLKGIPQLLGPVFKFKQYGQSGTFISELLPHTASMVDDLTFVHSLTTEQFNHSPAQLMMFTGNQRPGRPSMGAWFTYGLGSESSDLPGFVAMTSGRPDRCGAACIGTGFLPTVYQGVPFRSGGDPVLYLSNPDGIDASVRRDSLDAMRELNLMKRDGQGDPEIDTRIASYEMAYRMQTSVPGLMDISAEPEHIHKLYGTEPGKKSFANNCLLARRLIERGVRYVQLTHGEWDHHGGVRTNLNHQLPARAKEVDQATAALIKDLKQRGLFDDTIIIWGGEFGRTPMLQKSDGGSQRDTLVGRDHHKTFTMWFAGGGFKGGHHFGATDELGYNPVENKVTVHDMQATLLHLMGMDHTKLTFKFQGRDYRLTDVHGNVMHDLII